MKVNISRRNVLLSVVLFLTACQPQAALTSVVTMIPIPSVADTPTMIPTALELTPSFIYSSTPTLFPLNASDAPISTCDERRPAVDDLLAVVTASFGIAADYRPVDLVSLGKYLPGSVTLPENLMRREAAAALKKMVGEMKADGLMPTVLSSFRSYTEQDATRRRWEIEDPANASNISALPGHSEHQLGTVVDFGSPELRAMTDNSAIRFSPMFDQTSEGQWLKNHAHEYGFTLTNPQGAQPWTGLAYEPWHYRYIGVDLATYLYQSGYFLTEYLFQVRPGLPCIPSINAP
jgi:D-alanyl-D-alanine carboxypeptidase